VNLESETHKMAYSCHFNIANHERLKYNFLC